DHGFDDFYGPARTYTECLWPDDPWYDPARDPVSYLMEGTKTDGVHERADLQLTLQARRDVDAEYLRRGQDFIRRHAAGGRPFFLYFNHSMMHMPTVPREEFAGRSGQGEWADCFLE